MARPRNHLHIGLRVFKTALAVTISLWIAQGMQAYSPIFAGLGAMIGMGRTLRDALRDARTQVVGLLLGALVSVGLLLIDPAPPVWLTGLGMLAIMALCSALRLYYALSLASVIVLSVCVSTSGDAIAALGFRLLDTAVGLAVGLAVNMLIRPYNNRRQIEELLYDIADCVPSALEQRILRDLYPDLSRCEKLLQTAGTELEIYRCQYFRRRAAHARNVAHLEGLAQLAERIHQNLGVIAAMEPVGVPTAENRIRLRDLGLDVPAAFSRAPSETVDTVTNYHLEKVLDAYQYLLDLLNLPPEPEEVEEQDGTELELPPEEGD
ncbi:MAG: hypothetical protein HFF17_11700 [Oscillospiraceae bacterium]|nr:hypothetical protein [Oscillospiraceae bacterium]